MTRLLIVLLAVLAMTAATPAAAEPVRLSVPEPTGRYPVGTKSLHLIDRSRPDPWVAVPYRELMVSVFYPARDTAGYRRAPYLPPGAAGYLSTTLAQQWQVTGEVDLGRTRTSSFLGAPARPGRWPVVLFSPGHLAPRAHSTMLVEDLASHGYVVVTIDHTYETVVDFPHGRVEPTRVPVPDPNKPDLEGQVVEFNRTTIAARVADTRTVLDQLNRRLPGLLDLSRVGMFGHSGGGATTAEAMYYDKRIKAGAVVDSGLGYDFAGKVVPPVVREGLDQPVLLFASEQTNMVHTNDPSLKEFWPHLRGWHRDLRLVWSNHVSFADYEALIPQLVAAGAVDLAGQTPRAYLKKQLGRLAPARAIAATRGYLRAFFDLHLRGRATDLFDRSSFPVDVIP